MLTDELTLFGRIVIKLEKTRKTFNQLVSRSKLKKHEACFSDYNELFTENSK